MVLTCQSISNLQDLYGFFSSLSVRWPTNYTTGDAENDYKNCLEEIESILANDFLEKMPTNMTTARWKIIINNNNNTNTNNSNNNNNNTNTTNISKDDDKCSPYFVWK